MIATALGIALLAWSYAVTCTTVYGAGRAAWQRRRRAPGPVAERPRVLVVRPCAGLEADLERALVSLAKARASEKPACRFAVGSAVDPACDVAERAAAALRSEGMDASVVITNADAPNHKAAQLEVVLAAERALRAFSLDGAAGGPKPPRSAILAPRARTTGALQQASERRSTAGGTSRHARKGAGMDAVVVADGDVDLAGRISRHAQGSAGFDVIVVADSDVDLAGVDLDALTSPLFEAEGGGAIWVPPVETGALTASGDRASHALLHGSLHAFTILGALDGGGLVGKLFAVREDAIRAAGGFGAMERVLGEDMELARRLRAAGRTVRVAPSVARSLKTGRTWKDAVERYARWLTVIRAQRPHLLASYPLLFFSAPIVVLLGLLLVPFAPGLALAAIAFALGSRMIAALSARALAGAPFDLLASIADAAIADALLASAFARAVFTRTLTWRGRALTIDRRGQLSGRAAEG